MKHDSVYLHHILDEISFLIKESDNIDLGSFLEDETLKRAFARSLEIMGEAVKNLSEALRKKHPDVEWGKIAGLRDKLIHHYFGVDWDLIWDIIRNKLPAFKTKLEITLKESVH